jgi:hypothetical protein
MELGEKIGWKYSNAAIGKKENSPAVLCASSAVGENARWLPRFVFPGRKTDQG